MSKRRNRDASVRYSSQYARLKDMSISSLTSKHYSAHFIPRQLRGPFEKTTRQFSKALDSGCNHRSGRNSCARANISSENDTQKALWLTMVCCHASDMKQWDRCEALTPPGILTPDITAPDGGTMRGRPAGTAIEMRNASLTTAVCSVLRANSYLTNERTYQKRKLLEFFIARGLVEDRPHSVHFVH